VRTRRSFRLPAGRASWLLLATGLALAPPAPRATSSATAWRPLEAGLELGTFPLPTPSPAGDSRARVVRIDPGLYELHLLMASASPDSQAHTAAQWCRRAGFVAAINASMYQTDARTSTSLMKTRRHTNNPRLTRDNSVLVFDPLEPGLPPVQIVDRTCHDFDALRPRYGTLIQGIRMLGCDGANTWSPQPRRWSAAAIGLDRQGRVLLIHVRSPYTMHDLVEMLRQLPLDLAALQYAEGGPEAQLYVRGGGEEHEFLGSYETGFFESDGHALALPVPNVVGVRRR
jgi:hypothetical protein